jgi:hypothetical protein
VLAVILVGLPLLALPTQGLGQFRAVAGLTTGSLSPELLPAVLLAVLWVVWVQFLVCVAVEAHSLRRGSGLPPRAWPATAWQQDFVRKHVSRIALAVPVRDVRRARAAPVRARRRPPTSPAPATGPRTRVTWIPGADAQPEKEPASALESSAVPAPPPAGAGGGFVRRGDVTNAPLLSAGLVHALTALRDRRAMMRAAGEPVPLPDADALTVEASARIGADESGAAFLDGILRWLSYSMAVADRPPLRLLAARLTGETLELVLDEPRRDLPSPLASTSDPRRWTVSRQARIPAADAPAAAPALVAVGGDGIGRVLVDLGACRGVVCVTGEPNPVRSVVAAIGLELLTARWSDAATVTLVGFGRQLAPLGGHRVTCVDSLGEALGELTGRLERAEDAVHEESSAPASRLVIGGGASPVAQEVVVLAAPPSEAELALLSRFFGRAPLVVLVAGDTPAAVWRFALGADGVLDIGPLRHRVGAQAVSAATFRELVRLVEAEVGPGSAVLPSAVASRTPRPVDPGDVPVVLHLLGKPRITGDVGPMTLQDMELATFLAFRRTASFEDVVATLLPRGVDAAEPARLVERLQHRLGPGTDGRPRLVLDDGVLRLSPEVQTDWHVLLSWTQRVDEEAVSAVSGLLSGTPLTPWPRGRYGWLVLEPLTHVIQPWHVDWCIRRADEHLAAGNPRTAVRALAAGLRVAPQSGALWSRLQRCVRPHRDTGAGVVHASPSARVPV